MKMLNFSKLCAFALGQFGHAQGKEEVASVRTSQNVCQIHHTPLMSDVFCLMLSVKFDCGLHVRATV